MPNVVTNNRMYCYLFTLLIFISSISLGQPNARYRKLVYQKDMSEHCRRRVMPSVFLGRQVVDANSKILHFSRLETPYSCFVTVRTEMGSDIIVVIQLIADVDIEGMCNQGINPFVIYALGETFGEYWAQMPDSVLKRSVQRDDSSYTLTTEPTESEKLKTETEESIPPTTTVLTTESTEDQDKSEQYFTVELPILNVSAILVPGDISNGMKTEDKFDLLFDVTPRSGTSYDSRELPLVEVALQKKKGRLRDGNKDQEVELSPEFQVEFNDLFKADPRLPFPLFHDNTRATHKYNPIVNRRFNFKKNKPLFTANKKKILKYRRPQSNTVRRNSYISKIFDATSPSTKYTINSWSILHDILKNLTKGSDVSTQPPHKELANLLQGISNRQFNKSVYLAPDLSYLDTDLTNLTAEEHNVNSTTMKEDISYLSYKTTELDIRKHLNVSNKLSNKSSDLKSNNSAMNNDVIGVALLPLAVDVDNIILNVTNPNTDNIPEIPTKATDFEMRDTTLAPNLEPSTVSLVDHESWENVVKAAPVMAVKLNQSTATDLHDDKPVINVTTSRLRRRRRKRVIHAIDIESAHPHRIQVMKHLTTTTAPEKFDIREFQRLVELQDDEFHNRMAIRYLGQYVGSPLLSFCDFNDSKLTHVFLFKSSRLALSIHNFTLKRMTVLVTPARTLVNSDSHCGAAHLECQVSGERVCIDSHSACDGVPNCGSYDIYDEDRLICGATDGVRHNVALAAVTFLAVLLTILYCIHYWLKRCVPKVSDAFFVYTDAAENVLYLNPIMRSPNDQGGSKDFCREGILPHHWECEDIPVKKISRKIFIDKIISFFRCRRKKVTENDIVETELDNLNPQHNMSLLPEVEINKISDGLISLTPERVDVAVETGSSLDFGSTRQNRDNYDQTKIPGTFMEQEKVSLDFETDQPSADELSMLKFFRQARARSTSLNQSVDDYLSDIMMVNAMTARLSGDEKEVQALEYNAENYSVDHTDFTIHEEPIDRTTVKLETFPRKQLRFRDEAMIIPADDDIVEDEGVESTTQNRRSIVYGANKVLRIQEADPTATEDQSASATSREFKSYFNWGGGKEKKKKKQFKKN